MTKHELGSTFSVEGSRRRRRYPDQDSEPAPSLVPDLVEVVRKKPSLPAVFPSANPRPESEFAYTTVTRDELRANYRRLPTNPDKNESIVEALSKRVIGQPEAVATVARHIAIVESGFNDPRRPLASILELGPTGVGKTELAKATAQFLFGQEWQERFLLINGPELSEKHTALRLTGSPPSYVGNTEKALISHDWLHKGKTDKTPQQRTVIVFDELEKAHISIHDALLSILDEGRLHARNSEKGQQPLDFTRSWIFATSNVGAFEMRRSQLGFPGSGSIRPNHQEIEKIAKEAMEKSFRPEFLNRFTDIIVFRELGEEQLTLIFDKFLAEKNDQFSSQMDHPPVFAVTPELRELLVAQTDKRFGGRGLRNLVDKRIFGPAAQQLNIVDLADSLVVADYEDRDDEVVFYAIEDQIK